MLNTTRITVNCVKGHQSPFLSHTPPIKPQHLLPCLYTGPHLQHQSNNSNVYNTAHKIFQTKNKYFPFLSQLKLIYHLTLVNRDNYSN